MNWTVIVPDRLRAIVIGAGFAGEGHTLALRHAGADVVALCARDQQVVRAVADRLGVPQASTDWQDTLAAVRPDIVALAAPAVLRGAVIEVAAALGCHVLCEKPLATTAAEARRLFELVERAGVKHAYGATHAYDPAIAGLAELMAEGAIGTLRELDGSLRLSWSPLRPWSWYDRLDQGGGVLNNLVTHQLAIAQVLAGGPPLRVAGEARPFRARAPLVPDIHDIRGIGDKAPAAEEAAALAWRDCDADGACSALLRFAAPSGELPVRLVCSALVGAVWPPNGWRVYGDEGTLEAEGFFSYRLSRRRGDADPQPLAVPQRLLAMLPDLGDDALNKWAALARDFVADLRGEPHRAYPTFRDGWRFQSVIDAIRAGAGWQNLPADTEQAAMRAAF